MQTAKLSSAQHLLRVSLGSECLPRKPIPRSRQGTSASVFSAVEIATYCASNGESDASSIVQGYRASGTYSTGKVYPDIPPSPPVQYAIGLLHAAELR
ncbi:hypothetical protein KM043_013070 [Ampulex compressa]|nr:hypothetical protein KM043_013070 [Ampulex compressa]